MGAGAHMLKSREEINPITSLDYPDTDLIRVDDTYYMISTTMHFMPGCEILRSYDLLHWEHATYVYDTLDGTPAQKLQDGKHIYGKGMWAASLRYHEGKFYVCFVANDTGKTYLFTSDQIDGSWKKQNIDGFYHDCSLLFDDDGKTYIAYGNRDIYITELNDDLSGPKKDGFHKLVVSDKDNPNLGYEGTHFYKINGYYYLLFIHSLSTRWRRTQAVFVAASLDDEFIGRDVFNDDCGYCDMGIAQGGFIDTPDGKWYAMLFQDRGAVGRIPMLVPVYWDGMIPTFGEKGKIPNKFLVPDEKEKVLFPLVQSDDFKMPEGLNEKRKKQQYGSFGFKSCWQFNHEPDLDMVEHDTENGFFTVTTNQIVKDVTQAGNMLTQRMIYPGCEGEITVDVSEIQDGDYAGLCALQGSYGFVAVTRQNDEYFLVMQSNETKKEPMEWEKIFISDTIVRLKIRTDFTDMKDEATFYYCSKGIWKRIGITKKLHFGLDHFCGCRFGLFLFSTVKAGGRAKFSNFVYKV